MPELYVLDAKRNQFADPHAGGRGQPHQVEVAVFLILPQPAFQVFIVGLGYNLVQICFLLYLYHRKRTNVCFAVFKIRVERPDPQVDGLRFIVLYEINFVKLQIAVGQAGVAVQILFHRKMVNVNGVGGQVVG